MTAPQARRVPLPFSPSKTGVTPWCWVGLGVSQAASKLSRCANGETPPQPSPQGGGSAPRLRHDHDSCLANGRVPVGPGYAAASYFRQIAFSPSGTMIGAAYAHDRDNGGAVQFWNVSTGETLQTDVFELWPWDFAFSRFGDRYAFFSASGLLGVAKAPYVSPDRKLRR